MEKIRKFKAQRVKRITFTFQLSALILGILGTYYRVYAQEKKGKECIPIEADEMQRRYENKPFLFDNMFIFDLRPYAVGEKVRGIPFVKRTNRDMFKVKYIYNIKLWKGKDVYLVGKDTESTKSFCEEMIRKDYGVNDIYYLKGGTDTWKGAIMVPWEEVECEGLGLRELTKMKDAGQKVYLIDWRYPKDFYNGGHIPGSMNGYGREGVFGGIEDMLRGYFRFRPIYIKLVTDNAIAVYISYTEEAGRHRCRTEKRVSGINRMYYLKGGLENWEGPIKKETWQQEGRYNHADKK